MKSFAFKFPVVASWGHSVSHAKNRHRRGFKYNLHSVTVIIDGIKKKMKVPAKMIKMLRKSGVTTHYKPAVTK